MKKIEWINGNKMKVESGNKTFDRKCVCISTGNVIGPTQTSYYIRSCNDTINSVKQECPVGHLRNYDINQFRNLPNRIHSWFEEHKEKEVILYNFFHYNKDLKINHGYIITDENNHFLYAYRVGTTYKSLLVLYECVKYITVEKITWK